MAAAGRDRRVHPLSPRLWALDRRARALGFAGLRAYLDARYARACYSLPQVHGLRWSAPALLDVLAAASEATLRRVAVFAAERGAAAAGLDTLAPVAAALARLRNGATATAGGDALDQLVRQLDFASRAVGFATISRQATAEERMARAAR